MTKEILGLETKRGDAVVGGGEEESTVGRELNGGDTINRGIFAQHPSSFSFLCKG